MALILSVHPAVPDRKCPVWQRRYRADVVAALPLGMEITAPGGKKRLLNSDPLESSGLLITMAARNNLNAQAPQGLKFIDQGPLAYGT